MSLSFGRGSRVEGSTSRVEGSMSRVEGSMSRVEGSMSRVEGPKTSSNKLRFGLKLDVIELMC